MLLNHSNQAVSATDLQKKTKELLDRISLGVDDHLVVMRDNRPTAVMMGTERYEAMMDELADLRVEAVARARMTTAQKEYVSAKDMSAFVDSL
jgi:antitoxin StbD